MVKLHCDRCEEEIKESYYTISFYSYETEPKRDEMCDYATASYYSPHTRDSALQILNAQRMYCAKCKDKIEKFILNEV